MIRILFALLTLPLASEEAYFTRFEALAKAEKWEEIIAEGREALAIAVTENSLYNEAKICAQLTSSSFYLGDYAQALLYANRCHELSESFTDPSLYLRALYLESAVYRAQKDFDRAVEVAEGALRLYQDKELDNPQLLAKIYFNLGAAHADNPSGNLNEAVHCYSTALECAPTPDDQIRTSIRLGKVYLLQKDFAHSQEIITQVRPQITNERLAMHADYLEAQLKAAMNETEAAILIANRGLAHAINLGAKEDESRLLILLKSLIRENP